MRGSQQRLPVARREGLLIETLPDEVLVYDLVRKKAHCLNQTAALIWKHCDGKTSIEEMANTLQKQSSANFDEDAVWYGLKQLGKARLLDGDFTRPSEELGLSRRELVKRIGLAVSVPLVISVLAPNASAVLSCVGQACPGGTCPSPCTCNMSTHLCV